MMKYYLDITLLPGAEDGLGFLWQKVYQQIHIALVDNAFLSNEIVKAINGKQERLKKSHIAVSFPEYGSKTFPLGAKLRLFAQTQEQLNQLDVSKWLNRLTDYTHCKSIQTVDNANIKKHVCFKRRQFKSAARIAKDIERRAKYLVDKNGKNFEKVKARLVEKSKMYDDRSTLPFINIIGLSSKPDVPLSDKDRFLLFIEMQDMNIEIKGDFTCYGFSKKQATVPWF